MTKFQLYYFNGKGRAELTRLIFAAAGETYEDVRVSDWPAGKDNAPLGQLPYLVVDDNLKIPQSISIARFLARRFNLAGRDELEQVKADVIVDTLVDFFNSYIQKVFIVQDAAAKKEALDKFLSTDAKSHLGNLEKLVGLYGSNGYSVGSALTWADLLVFEVTSVFSTIDANLLSGYHGLLNVRKSVENYNKVAAYLKSRPETPF